MASTSTTESVTTPESLPFVPKDDRIYADVSNLADLKATCDDAVERILTKTLNPIAPAPSSSPSSSHLDVSQATNITPDQQSQSDGDSTFPPFKASHFHTDLRLVLGYVSSTVVIGVSLWSYFIEKQWNKNKYFTALAVGSYIVVSGIQALDSYIQGDKIFTGKRKTLSSRIETEYLSISSPQLAKAVIDDKKELIPPNYKLIINYTRSSNGGKSTIKRIENETIDLGTFSQWFTQSGEFIEEFFQKKLADALQSSWRE
ncbi:unnamed protein product [Sympodiomycopsis kandeliae]